MDSKIFVHVCYFSNQNSLSNTNLACILWISTENLIRISSADIQIQDYNYHYYNINKQFGTL